MNHLIRDADLSRIESQLLLRRDQLVQATAWSFNLLLLVLIVGSFVVFLYVQYTSHTQEVQETKRIPFTPTTWYSATRNVRNEEYGRALQPLDTQVGYGVPEQIHGGLTSSVF
jgi:glucan phosphoethanolaminetransferase (alkaline phosphatase superfamily)